MQYFFKSNWFTANIYACFYTFDILHETLIFFMKQCKLQLYTLLHNTFIIFPLSRMTDIALPIEEIDRETDISDKNKT